MLHSRRSAASGLAGLVVGVVGALAFASPAAATEGPRVINDGAIACSATGAIFVPWHVENPFDFDIVLTSFTETPADPDAEDTITGTVVPAGDSLEIIQFVVDPDATAAGLAFTWEKVGDSTVGGSFSGESIQEWPEHCEPIIKAEFTANCDRTVTVKLINLADDAHHFLVNGASHEVEAGATLTVPNVATNQAGKVVVEFDIPETDLDLPVGTFTWTAPDCPSTTTTTNPPLAATGASLTGPIGLGAALLVVGSALVAGVLVLRRRRAVEH